MNHRLRTLALAWLTLALLSPARAGGAGKPFVIPELKQWKARPGTCTLGAGSRIVVAGGGAAARRVAEQLAEDYRLMFGTRLPIATGRAAQGDITLALRRDRRLGEEGYRISVGREVSLTAGGARGLYWATRSLLQMLDHAQGRSLPRGVATDWPDYPIRGAMLDCGRKFIPMSMLRDFVRQMAYCKMNFLHVHLNDNGFRQFFDGDWDKTQAAFRLECDTYPGLTARDGWYTKRDFVALQQLADSLGVEIVPEIDVPAHSLAFAHYRPSLGSKEFGMDHLDLYNPAVRGFCDSLFAEYLEGPEPVFRGRYVHIGTDEYSNRTQDLVERFRAFTDHYIRLVERYGKTAVIWGSQTHARGTTPIKVDGVLMNAWSNDYSEPDSMAHSLGYDLIATPDRDVYIVPAAGYYRDYLDCEKLYAEWTPAHINGHAFAERDPKIKGGIFAVWNDIVGNGISDQDIHYRALPALRTIAAKTWAASPAVAYADFAAGAEATREAPGVNYCGAYPAGLVLERDTVRPGDRMGVPRVGWDYEVSFDIEARPERHGTVLFQDGGRKFYLADPAAGLLGFSRDGYLYQFRYQLYPGEKARLAIRGDREETSLWVNGKRVETLGVKKVNFGPRGDMRYVQTLVFPLREAGADFRSRVTRLRVVSRR